MNETKNDVAIDVTKFTYSVQSANVLFHFMNKLDYLKFALRKKKLIPRYCKEDISHYHLPFNNDYINSIYVLEKCFCDIKFPNLSKKFKAIKTIGGRNESVNYSHIDLYGKYGIAFSKNWALTNWKIQPVRYININPINNQGYLKLVQKMFDKEELDDDVSKYVLTNICYTKPLEGKMERTENIDGTDQTITIQKNFSDECEWRYVPLDSLEIQSSVYLNINSKEIESFIKKMNDESANYEQYPSLDFSYKDIQYIIVPNIDAKTDLINMIDKEFKDLDQNQKYMLVSKIENFDDLERNL